jgi:PhnB protein
MAVDPIPAGYPRVTPYLCCRGAADAIEFYQDVLGATERMRMPGDSPDSIGHAELEIGTGLVMLADEFPGMGTCQSPQTLGGTASSLMIYSEDVDRLFNQAVGAGATVAMPLQNQFWGDRYGQVKDPFGHVWALGQHVEDVAPDEMERRGKEMIAQMSKGAARHTGG